MLSDDEWAERRRIKAREKARVYYQKNKEKIKERSRKWKEKNPERKRQLNRESMARRRATSAELREKERVRRKRDWAKVNQEYVRRWSAVKRRRNPMYYLLHAAKTRAKKEGIQFSITLEDVPMPAAMFA